MYYTPVVRFYHVDTVHQTEWMKLCIDVMNTLRQVCVCVCFCVCVCLFVCM